MSSKHDALRAYWERATEVIDQDTEDLRRDEYAEGVPRYVHAETLAAFAEFADSVQRYLGIEVNHDKLREDSGGKTGTR